MPGKTHDQRYDSNYYYPHTTISMPGVSDALVTVEPSVTNLQLKLPSDMLASV